MARPPVPYIAPVEANDQAGRAALAMDDILAAGRILERELDWSTIIPSTRLFRLTAFPDVKEYDLGMPIDSIVSNSVTVEFRGTTVSIDVNEDTVVDIVAKAGFGYLSPLRTIDSVDDVSTTGFGSRPHRPSGPD